MSSLESVFLAALFLICSFRGVTTEDCPQDFPFPSCPRNLADTPDDIVCCYTEDGLPACCSGFILAAWIIVLICISLIIVIGLLILILCCVCPCCLYAARRSKKPPVTTEQVTNQVIINQGVPQANQPPLSYDAEAQELTIPSKVNM